MRLKGQSILLSGAETHVHEGSLLAGQPTQQEAALLQATHCIESEHSDLWQCKQQVENVLALGVLLVCWHYMYWMNYGLKPGKSTYPKEYDG